MTVREARLRPEYAGEYPGIAPDVWMSAKELAKNLVARVHARRKQGLHTRTFDPTHFEFRGGDDIARIGRHRSRSTDGPITSTSHVKPENPAGAEAPR